MPTKKTISLIIPVFDPKEDQFRNTLKSLTVQTNSNFEVCISDAGSHKVKKIVDEFKDQLDIKYASSTKKLKIAANTNKACELATGEYLAFLDHDDLLTPDAIEELSATIEASHPDVIYSDESVIDQSSRVLRYSYKPDFSPDLLYGGNYICHLLCVRRGLAEKIGFFKSDYDGAQDYDFTLRLTEHTSNIVHIPKVLYQWVAHPDSTATNPDSKPYAQVSGLRALNDHLERTYHGEAYAIETSKLFNYQTIFKTFDRQKVEIIIPFRDGLDMTRQCVESIIKHSKNYNYSITLLDNRSKDPATKAWLQEISKDSHVKILEANFDFNWSKLQNFGIKHSDAEVFVFLNNDTIINDDNWLQVLCSNALREDIGVVGPLLLYPDKAIQHAGVVVGLGGYADHLYRGMYSVGHHIGTHYFVSPFSPRNVTAVTGACMVISRRTLNQIGLFNERFIICGSDVEICLRAYKAGLRNLYTPFTTLTHLESKTRDTYIPKIDFKLSKKAYQEFWDNGDPFYNPNLSLRSLIPSPRSDQETSTTPSRRSLLQKSAHATRELLKRNALLVKAYRWLYRIDEKEKKIPVMRERDVQALPASAISKPRINLVIPAINKDYIFGGISTALKFFDSFSEQDYDKRIIVHDIPVSPEDLAAFPGYEYTNDDSSSHLQITDSVASKDRKVLVSENDIFIASAWWTARSFYTVIDWQKQHYELPHPHNLIYLIQDYEPGFYAWSSDYIGAESTYRSKMPVTAVFNSSELKKYFDANGYHFDQNYTFEPILNDTLKEHLLNDPEKMRQKQIIIYGRPSVDRNAFDIIVYVLRQVFGGREDASNWTLLSMGEQHPDIGIADGVTLKSVGKLSLSEYAKIMEESYLGISLMLSPHPSYPPLEMSSFGVKTITNTFATKDLSDFNDNIISIKDCDPDLMIEALINELDRYSPSSSRKAIKKSYIEADHQFETIATAIGKTLFDTSSKKSKGER